MAVSRPVVPVEWDYTDGLPENNGFTKSTSSTGASTATLRSDCVEIVSSGSGATYYQLLNRDFTVVEIEFLQLYNNGVSYFSVRSGANHLQVRAQYSSNYKGIYLRNASAIASMTKLTSMALNTTYKVRLEINGGRGNVYVNGTQVANNVDLSTIYGSSGNVIQIGASGSSSTTIKLYSIKYA